MTTGSPAFSNIARTFLQHRSLQKKAPVLKDGKDRLDLVEGAVFSNHPYASLPDKGGHSLRRALGEFLTIHPKNILLFAGADEIIELIPRLFLNIGETSLTVVPTFERLIETNRKAGGVPRLFRLKPENDFKMTTSDVHDISVMADSLSAKIIWLCTPNNPTGIVIPLRKIAALAEQNPSRLIVVNEVYQEYYSFRPQESATSLIHSFPNILVIRSFSKAFGLAGARIGYAVANIEILSAMEMYRTMFCISTPAQELAESALQKNAMQKMREMVQRVRRERVALEEFLLTLTHLQVIRGSETNFLFLRAAHKNAWDELIKQQIVSSDWRAAPGIENMGFIRISIGTADVQRRLKTALQLIDHSA